MNRRITTFNVLLAATLLAGAALAQDEDDEGDAAAPSTASLDSRELRESFDSKAQIVSALAQYLSSFEISGLDFNVDIASIEDGKIAFDYNLEYDFQISEGAEGIADDRLSMSFLSTGYLSEDEQDNRNSIITELRFSGELMDTVDRQGEPKGRVKALRSRFSQALTDIEPLDPFDPMERAQGNEILTAALDDFDYMTGAKSLRFVKLDFHGRTETDQGFEDAQYAIGLGLTTDLALITGNNDLAKILDAPFRAMRSGKNPFIVQLPRLHLTFDYITDSDIATRMALTDDNEFGRLGLEVAWKTSILDNVDVRLAWKLYYEFDAQQEIKDADMDFASFFEVSAGIPVQNGTMIFVKYSDGRLIPRLEDESLTSVGFRVEF